MNYASANEVTGTEGRRGREGQISAGPCPKIGDALISLGIKHAVSMPMTKGNIVQHYSGDDTQPSRGTSRGTGFELIVPLRSGPGTGSRSTMTRSTRQPYIAPRPSQS